MEGSSMNNIHSLRKLIVIAALFVIPVLSVFSQQHDTLEALITTGTGSFHPTIAKNVDKIIDNPAVKDSTQKIPVGSFNINSKKLTTTYIAEPITAAQMVGEPLTKLYNG